MKKILGTLFIVLALTACEKEKHIPRPIDLEGRVLVMYDNIDDHPQHPFTVNVRMAGKAVAAGALAKEGQRVIVYHRGWRGTDGRSAARNTIYELEQDKGSVDGYRVRVLRQYAERQYDNLWPETISAVVGDIRAMAPGAKHWGFAFGSHGLGWIPKSNRVDIGRRSVDGGFDFLWHHPVDGDETRFLMGYNEKLDVLEFKSALDGWDWDFVLLDDCFMASVEALYDLRTLADYIIASPTEIMLEGFPYDRVVGRLFASWEANTENAMIAVSQGFVDYYKNDSASPYATISLVKSAQMDYLKDAVRNLYADTRFNRSLNPVDAQLQFYEGLTVPGHIFWDMDDYFEAASTNSELLEAFRVQLSRTVVWAGHTGYYYTGYSNKGPKPVSHFSGISTFVRYPAVEGLFPAYQDTEWYQDVYLP